MRQDVKADLGAVLSGFALCLCLFFPLTLTAQDTPLRMIEWRYDHPDFGGLSGLMMAEHGAVMTAASDRGGFFTARMLRDGAGHLTGFADVVFTPLTSHLGVTRPERFHSDIEALAPMGPGRIGIAFESYSRIQILPSLGGVPKPTHGWDRFQDLFGNHAFEALVMLPGGGLLAFVEGRGDDKTGLVYFWTGKGWSAHRVPVSPGYDVTGADMGPDGCLYLLERSHSLLSGFAFRLRRLQQSATRWSPELPWIRDELLYDSPAGAFRNAEALAAWDDAHGLHLTLVTDNGFSSRDVTQVIEMDVAQPCQD